MSQAENLQRVSASIGETVLEFCRLELAHVGGLFVAASLRDYVTRRHPHIAPASPDRILRDLRKRGLLDYEVINRAQSLYRVVRVSAKAGA